MQTFVRFIADGTVVVAVIIAVYSLIKFVPIKFKYEAYCRILMAGLTSLLVAKLLAVLYQPETLRPFELMGVDPGAAYLNNPGFPSDHALFVTALVLAVWFETKNKIVTSILVILLISVGAGRVLALVHTPTDVIGGVLVAFVGALWYLTATQRKSARKT
jgi:membrane-associated phospholipid phosphatase